MPIPTYYGDEICYVNGMSYAKDVIVDVVQLSPRHGSASVAATAQPTTPTPSSRRPHSSHGVLLAWLAGRRRDECSTSAAPTADSAPARAQHGHHVVGVDVVKHEGVGERLDEFVEADLEPGLPDETGVDFDVIIAADVLEHTVEPASLLRDMIERLAPEARSWSACRTSPTGTRGRALSLGRFDYDQRGLLDRGHVRFFTRRSFERLVPELGAPHRRARRRRFTFRSPRSRTGSTRRREVGRRQRSIAQPRAAWPTLFGYQFLYRLEAL